MTRLTIPLCGLIAFMGHASFADEPAPFRDFTFKRVGVPQAGSKRITVQIDPEEQARWLAAPSKAPGSAPPLVAKGEDTVPPVPRDTSYSWFWDSVPVNGLGADGLRPALGVLAKPPSGKRSPVYRLSRMKEIADRHGADLLRATVGTKVSPALALAVIAVESAGKQKAVSHAGAQGLMQLMPATAERFGVSDSMDAAQNIKGGVAYLDWLMGRFAQDPILVLAGYNAGEGAVDRHGGVPPYAETMDYVPKVLAAFQVAKGLCATQPILVSDGCVFVGDRMAKAD
ncbi:Soluble lytic murein transglycosylase [Palleronia abyssalis]|uniref:Soluble lytic murein transglycosylase n=2 Tax=Palleronia abyssalis TaxID=1501240 RepID=A0A2R8BX82_9RHOB|nr:Soluble lytic murein transglycosylase [Palleronia abyssalis]